MRDILFHRPKETQKLLHRPKARLQREAQEPILGKLDRNGYFAFIIENSIRRKFDLLNKEQREKYVVKTKRQTTGITSAREARIDCHINPFRNAGSIATCDGVVTGIQRRALADDTDAYRSIKNPQ